MSLRWNKMIVLAALFVLSIPFAAYGDKEIEGSSFAFLHAPVNPEEPDGVCVNPLGLLFSVTSDSFGGILVTKKEDIPFTGEGNAIGCAFDPPVDGVSGMFTGSFSWQTEDGELTGTFELLDFPTEFEGVFAAVVFITFDGGTGQFKNAIGEAIAEGLDFPFGGIPGNPSAAGVVATIVEGKLKLKE